MGEAREAGVVGFLIVLAGVLAVALPVALLLHPEDGVTVPPPSTALRAELGAVLLRNEPPPRGDGQRAVLAEAADTLRWHQSVVLTVAHGLLGLEWSVVLVACLVDLARRAAPPRSVEYAPSEALAMQQASAPARKAKWKKALTGFLSCVAPSLPQNTYPSKCYQIYLEQAEGGKRKEKTDERNLWPHRISGFTHSLSGLSAREKCGVAGCSVAS